MNPALLLTLALGGGCLVSKPIGDADTNTGSEADASSDPGEVDASSDPSGMTSMVDDTGDDPDGDPYRVDCAEQDWNVTIGGGEPGALGFPVAACNPRTSGSANGYQCCSTDPATPDGSLPAYEGKGIAGSPPMFADLANDAGTWGVCVRTDDIPGGSGLLAPGASNCPIPCNPGWSSDDVSTVCGSGRVCCQVHEVRGNDCVQEDGVWRAVTGVDIGSAGVSPPTNWNATAHATHQDPGGTVCSAMFELNSTEFNACVRQLSVANQRGLCMALGFGQVCPSNPLPPPNGAGYRNACDLLNG